MLVIATLLAILQLACSLENIVNFFEWSHDDVAKQCENHLRSFRYDAVQVSPVTEHVVNPDGRWTDRFEVFSYSVDSRSGNYDQFRKMVETCNDKNIKVYVDVVLNNMASVHPEGTKGTAGAQPSTSKKIYEYVGYNPDDFHPSCDILDPSDIWEVRNCEVMQRQDLNQTKHHVRVRIAEFMNRLIHYGVAGFRILSAKHMEPSDLEDIYYRLDNRNTKWFGSNSKPKIFQEVYSNPLTDKIKPQDYTRYAPVLDFKYGYDIAGAFNGNTSLASLHDFGEAWKLLPWKDSVVFIDNQETQRYGVFGRKAITFQQRKLYKMATGFMLAWPYERAVIMSSYEFGGLKEGPPDYPVRIKDGLICSLYWICEHLWKPIYSMVRFSRYVEGSKVTNWWSNGKNQIAFCRGNEGFVAFNNENTDMDEKIQTCLPPGVYCDLVTGDVEKGKRCTGRKVTVSDGGIGRVVIDAGDDEGFIAIYKEFKLKSDG